MPKRPLFRTIFIIITAALAAQCTTVDETAIESREVESAASLIDLYLTKAEIDSMLPDLADRLKSYQSIKVVTGRKGEKHEGTHIDRRTVQYLFRDTGGRDDIRFRAFEA